MGSSKMLTRYDMMTAADEDRDDDRCYEETIE